MRCMRNWVCKFPVIVHKTRILQRLFFRTREYCLRRSTGRKRDITCLISTRKYPPTDSSPCTELTSALLQLNHATWKISLKENTWPNDFINILHSTVKDVSWRCCLVKNIVTKHVYCFKSSVCCKHMNSIISIVCSIISWYKSSLTKLFGEIRLHMFRIYL